MTGCSEALIVRVPPVACDSALALEPQGVSPGNFVPVDDIPPRGEIVGAAVLVLKVVGVFPDVVAHDRVETVHQRTILIGGRGDREPAALDKHNPDPTGAEALDTCIVKGCLELVK